MSDQIVNEEIILVDEESQSYSVSVVAEEVIVVGDGAPLMPLTDGTGVALPSQAQAETIVDPPATPYLWSIVRLGQWLAAKLAVYDHPGSRTSIDASGFDGNLDTTDDTAQKVAQHFNDHDKVVLDELLTVPRDSWYAPALPALASGEAYLMIIELVNAGAAGTNNIRLNGYSGATDYGVASSTTNMFSGAAGAWSDLTNVSIVTLFRNQQGRPTAYWFRSGNTAAAAVSNIFTGGMLNKNEAITGIQIFNASTTFTGRIRIAVVKHRGL